MSDKKIVLGLACVTRLTETIPKASDSYVEGLLLGLRDGSTIYANSSFPLASRLKSVEGVERLKKEILKLRAKLYSLNEQTKDDPLCVGIYGCLSRKCTRTSLAVDPNQLKMLYFATTNLDPLAVLLLYDQEREKTSQDPFTAFALSEPYIALASKLETDQLSAAEFDAAVARIEPLVEVPTELATDPVSKAIMDLCHPDAEILVSKDYQRQEFFLSQRARALADMASMLEELIDSEKQFNRPPRRGDN